MALIDKASLLMVPSTYEAGKLYNVLPSGNRAPDNKGGAGYDQTRADFDFDRGSNAAATRIGSDGLLKKYQENLLLQSNNFGTTWVNNGTIETSGQSGYDGSSDAWLLEKSIAGGSIRQAITYNGVGVFSIYAKASSLNHMLLYINYGSGTDSQAYFNLLNGSVGTTIAEIDAKIVDVGNGWYRCSIAFNTPSATATILVFPSDADGSTSGTTGSILIQSAQLETGLVATDYLNSTSVTAKAGVLIDLPRINYDANGENGALLLEPSRQQLLPFSEYFNNWTALLNITPYPNAIVSPEGLLNAAKLVEDSATATHRIYQIVSITSGQSYTQSVFAKEGERRYLQIAFGSKISGTDYANFDLKEGEVSLEVGSINATIEPYGNGWYRCSATSTANITSSEAFYYTIVDSGSASRFASYTGNGTSGAYIFGAQVEPNASYVSSYIPNHSGTGGVTRAADSCSVTGASDVIGQTEGTLYAEAKIKGLKNSNTIVTLHNGSFAEYLVIAGNNSGNINAYIFAGGVQQAGIFSGTYAVDSVVKCAMAYKENDVAFYINGVLIGTDSSATMASTSVFDVGSISFGNYPLHGTIKQAILFNERLSNSELATLTTL